MATYAIKLVSPSLHCPSCVSYITDLLEDVQARNKQGTQPPSLPNRFNRLRADVSPALTGASGRGSRLVRIPSSASVDSTSAAASLRRARAELFNVQVSLLTHSIHFHLSFASAATNDVDEGTLVVTLKDIIQSLLATGYEIDSIQVNRRGRDRVDSHSHSAIQTLDLLDLQLGSKADTSPEVHAGDETEEDQQGGHTAIDSPAVPSLLSVRTLVAPREEWNKRQSALRRRIRWKHHVAACKACHTSLASTDPSSPSSSPALSSVAETGGEDSEFEASDDLPISELSPDTKQEYTIKMIIGGMTCSSCVSSIEGGVTPLVEQGVLVIPKDAQPGIRIDLIGGTATAAARATPSTIDMVRDRLVETIDDLGFEVEVISVDPNALPTSGVKPNSTGETKWKVTFSIGGMTCASCVSNVEGSANRLIEEYVHCAVSSKPGRDKEDEEAIPPIKVASFQVNLMDGSALADFVAQPFAGAELKTKVKGAVEKYAEDLREAIDDGGYDTEIVSIQKQSPPQPQLQTSDKQQGPRRTVKISIEGMFCPSCIKKVKKEVLSWTEAFGTDRLSTKADMWDHFSLHHPVVVLIYRSDPWASTRLQDGSVLHLALRDFLARINCLDPGFSATFVVPPSLATRTRQVAQRELQSLVIRTVIAAIFAIPTLAIAVIAPALLSKTDYLRRQVDKPIWGSASKGEVILWCISTPVQFGVGSVFYLGSYHSLKSVWRKGRPWFDRIFRWGNMDVLVALATSVAYFTSMVFLFVDAAHPARAGNDDGQEGGTDGGMSFFDSCVFLNFFILLGRSLESWSKRRTGDAVAQLGGLKPTRALLAHSQDAFSSDVNVDHDESSAQADDSDSSTKKEVPVDMLEIGDLVLIRPGASPPLDCTVESPTTQQVLFNESSLTGEDRPVEKKRGDAVFTGTANAGQVAVVGRVTALSDSCMIDTILEAVREASGRKASIQRMADKLTGYFVPVIVYLALIVLVLWFAIVYGVVSQAWIERHVEHADRSGAAALFCIRFAVSVVVVACPCGIGLAAPAAQMVGLGMASKYGVLVNGGGEAFQVASQVKLRRRPLTILSDKTGTITMGEGAKVVDHRIAPEVDQENQKATILASLGLVEELSTHPIAVALLAFVHSFFDASITTSRPTGIKLVETQEVSGQGVEAILTVAGSDGVQRTATLFVGNEALMRDRAGIPIPTDNPDEGGNNLQRSGREWRQDGSIVIYVAWVWTAPSSTTQDDDDQSDVRTTDEPNLCTTHASLVGVFAIADAVRPETVEVLSNLKTKYSADVWMVTGDNEVTALAISRKVGIAPERVMAGLSPHGKQELIDGLRSGSSNEVEGDGGSADVRSAHCPGQRGMARAERLHGSRMGWLLQWGQKVRKTFQRSTMASSPRPLVMFIGDGINDSPALAAADVSLAMGSGSSIAHSSADFILLSKQQPLQSIETVLSISAATTFKIYQNFAWAAVFNLTLVPIAAGILEPVGFSLGPSWSGLAMALSSSSVVFNALLLNFWRPPKSVRSSDVATASG